MLRISQIKTTAYTHLSIYNSDKDTVNFFFSSTCKEIEEGDSYTDCGSIRTDKIKNRKPTGKKIKKNSAETLEVMNTKYESNEPEG